MRRIGLAGLLLAAPVGAQEVGLHLTSSAGRRDARPVAHGLGASLGGSFRLGDILADSGLARRANLRVGGRLSLSEMRFDDVDFSRCVDDCPAGAHDVQVTLRITQVSLFALPYASSMTRLEASGGIARYRYTSSHRFATWGFVAGAALSRRLGEATPVWLQFAYTRHAEGVASLADGGAETPAHSVRAGLLYRFADRRRHASSP
jgi:hypothetical protein